MATTLTLYLGVWPKAYLLQVGDSRCYLYRDGELSQITRDQTMAQELIDLGVLTAAEAPRRPGSPAPSPARSADARPTRWSPGSTCSGARSCCSAATGSPPTSRTTGSASGCAAMTSARQVCEDLLADALEAGGTDNITVIVGRALAREP